jgi:hypothetical protein
MKFDYKQLWRVQNSPEKEQAKRYAREELLAKADIVKINHACGIDKLTDSDWTAFVEWFTALRNMQDWAFYEKNIPSAVLHHLKKKEG